MTRKSKLSGIVTFAVVVLTLAMVALAFAQQGRGGPRAGRPGPGRGMMGDMMYLERSWTAVSFQLDCTNNQIQTLRPTFKTALDTRNSQIKAAMASGNMPAMVKAVTDCKSTLEKKLKQVLSEKQWKKLDDLITPRMGGMRRGGGPWRGGR